MKRVFCGFCLLALFVLAGCEQSAPTVEDKANNESTYSSSSGS